jgi:hypothetical protein
MRAAGYQIEGVRGIGFTVKGLPAALREAFSKRRQAILRQAGSLGATNQDDLQDIALETRARKTQATAASLRERWLQESEPWHTDLQTVIARANGKAVHPNGTTGAQSMLAAERHVFERASVVSDRLLLREALVVGRGEVQLDDLKRSLALREQAGALLRSGEQLASTEALEMEREFTSWAYGCREGGAPLGTFVSSGDLSSDQASAVKGLLAVTAGVVVLQGDAGTGKTTSLRHIVAGIGAAGGSVFGCAPSATATHTLRQELTPDADTLQRLLVDEALQTAVRGRVILVDEAGLVSVREMLALCRLASRNHNPLVLVGDIKQHHSVEAGDALRAIQRYGRAPVFRLTEIRRQLDPAYRKAVSLLARGDAFNAFGQFNRLKVVDERTPDTIWADAAADYVRTLRAGRTCLAISPLWSEIHAFSAAARSQLRVAGMLQGGERSVRTVHSLKWTREQKRRASNYQPDDILTFFSPYGPFQRHDSARVLRREGRELILAPFHSPEPEIRLDPSRAASFNVGLARDIPVAIGERLLIRANLPSADLRNGDIVEVSGFAHDGAIRLRDTRVIPAWFRELSHGYATTSHASQGRTVDRGILLMADEGIAAANLKQAYVSNSRFRVSQAIYTTDKAAAREAMMRPNDRLLAMELPAAPENSSLPVYSHQPGFRQTAKAA